MRKAWILSLVMLLAVMAVAQGPQHPSAVDPASAVTMANGLTYWDLAVGLGKEAVKGSKVKVHYTGWLLEEGTKFDSSLDRGKPLEFTIGSGQVIKGWEIGVAGMKAGGKRQLRIPPELAYGYRGQPPDIPRNAYLIFDVELLEVE